MKSYTHALSRHFRTTDSSSSTLVSSKADSSGPRRATVRNVELEGDSSGPRTATERMVHLKQTCYEPGWWTAVERCYLPPTPSAV